MTTQLINPATGASLREVPSTTVEETDAAVERAHDAFLSWRAIAPGERARLLRSFAAVVDDHIEELARLEVANSGHTIGNARWEAGNVRDCLNYYSAAPERLFGRQIPVAGGVDVTFREPLGVVGVIVRCRPASPKVSSPCWRVRGRSSGSGSSAIPWSGRCASRGRRRSASRSWPAVPTR
jgi:acyl-CoA reductase-like NAD-dependent aldehyde dehydrogenase